MSTENKREIRNAAHQVTSNQEQRTVEGYALLFDTQSDALPFDEVIERGALEGVIAKSDVFALLNHSQSRGILARSKNGSGSLTLTLDSKGLKYSFEAPKTPLGDELLENIKRGKIDQSSFAFTVAQDAWEKRSDGGWKRTIRKIEEIFDVSPVYNAAYSATSVYTRGKDLAERELREQPEKERRELDEYSKKIDKQFNF